MANLDTWILASKLPRNIVLSESREGGWGELCSNASDFLDQSPPSSVLYLPMVLNNARKKRFSACALTGDFPAAIVPLDSDIEGKIVSGLTRELNDCYCLNLPVNTNLQRGSVSPLLELGKGKLVLVDASHTNRMLALIPASLETQFLKLPGQSQTNDGVGDILAVIEQGDLKKVTFCIWISCQTSLSWAQMRMGCRCRP